MKYVMFKKVHKEFTQYVPIVFPNIIVHADMAKAMLAGPLAGFVVHSAGEVSPLDMKPHGESSTLNVKADLPDDERRLLMNDYGAMCE